MHTGKQGGRISPESPLNLSGYWDPVSWTYSVEWSPDGVSDTIVLRLYEIHPTYRIIEAQVLSTEDESAAFIIDNPAGRRFRVLATCYANNEPGKPIWLDPFP